MPESITRRSLLAAAAVPALRLPKKIKIGIAGMEGHIGEILNPIQGLPEVELVSASDADPARMAKLAPGVRRYSDYRQMLETERLGLVAIGGSNWQGAEILLASPRPNPHRTSEQPPESP